MDEKYNEELLNLGFNAEMMDGTKVERTFFAISESELRDVFHVLPNDSVEEARKKIIDTISKDDFLYKFFHKDPLIWELKEFTPGYWTVSVKEEKILDKSDLAKKGFLQDEIDRMRLPVKSVDIVDKLQQKMTIKFVKRQPHNIMDDGALKAFYEKFDEEFKSFIENESLLAYILKNKMYVNEKTSKKKGQYDESKLLVIPDVELHIGKLASKFDSTDSYDYKKALYRYSKIINETEKVQDMYKASTICMTIGNDFFNTDTEQNTTTAGTEQHNDTRFQQMITNGIVAHVIAIDRLKEKCDKLIIKYNPGNHDQLIDYTLYMLLYTMYKDDPKVEIESRVKDNRWTTGLKWNKNLIIFAHGKTPEGKALNDDRLALLRDTIYKEEARDVDYTTVLAGHLHNATVNNYSSKKKHDNGVTVIRSGSPSGDGAWDSGNLYSSDKSHQVYVFDAQKGLYSTVNLSFTKDELERGISVGEIKDDTDYYSLIDKSLNAKMNDLVNEDMKKANEKNEKAIKEIEKKYETIYKKLISILDNEDISDEKKQQILTSLGLDSELKPLLDRRSQFLEKGYSRKRKK